MEWETVLIEWVNCLRLTERPITHISDVSDGRFFCEVLQIRFDKVVNIQDIQAVFKELENALKDYYEPSYWIDFAAASRGDETELMRILSVLIATCSLQEQAKLFRENPASYLNSSVQLEIKRYLQSVLQNSRVVSDDLLSQLVLAVDKENKQPRESGHHTKKMIPPRQIPQSPHIYVSSPQTPRQQNRRERESSTDTEKHQAETIEKLNAELLLKSSTISELESRNSDLASKLEGKASELKNLNEKNLHLKNRVEDHEKVLEELTENLRVKSEELAQLLGQLEDLRVQHGRTGAENEKLVQENAVLMKDRDGLIEHAQELEKEYARSTEATNGKISDLMHDLEQRTRELQEWKETSSVLEAKCANLTNSLESYKNSLEEAKQNLEKSEEEFSTSLNRLSIDMAKERERAFKAEELLQESESCVNNCNDEIAILKDQLQCRIEAEKKLQAELLEKSSTISELESRNSDLASKLEGKASELKNLNEKNLHLKNRLEDHEKILEELTENLRVKSEELAQLLGEMEDLRVQHRRTGAENEKLVQENEVLMKERDGLIEHAQELEKEYARSTEATNGKISDLTHGLEHKTRELQEWKETSSVLEAKCANLTNMLESSKNSLEEAKRSLEKIEAEFSTSLNRLSIDMAKERERACKAEKLLQESESCVNNCNEEIAILKERLTSGIEAEKKLEAELLVKSSTISELESRSSDLASKLEGKASELKNLNEKNLHLKNRLEDHEKILEELTENLRVKSEELAQLLGQLEDLRVQLGRAGAENEKLVQENEVLMKDRDGLIEHAQELEKEYARSTEATNRKISDLMHDLEQKTRELQEWKENSSILEAKCTNLTNSLELYKNSLEEAKQNLEKLEEEFSTSLDRLSIDMAKERERACKAEKLLQKSESCVNNCNDEIAILKDQLACRIEAEEKLEAELLVKSSTISELESRSSDLASKLEGKASELKNLNEKNLHLKNRVEDLEKVLEELTENLRVKSEELAQLLGQMEDLRVQHGRTGAENEKLVQENAVLMNEKDGLIEHAQELEKEYARSTEATNRKISDLTHDLEHKTRELQEWKENSSVLEAKCANLANSLESYKNSLEEAKRSSEKSEEEFSTSLNRLSIDMAKERERACKAEKLLQESESCVNNCNDEIAILKDRLACRIEAEEKLEAALLVKSSTISELESRSSDLASKLEGKASELKNLNEENFHLKNSVEDLEKVMEELTENLRVKSEELAQLLGQLEDLGVQHGRTGAENEKLVQENAVLMKDRDGLIEHAQELEKEYARSTEATNGKVSDLMHDLEQKTREVQEWKGNSSVLEAKCADLTNSLESYKNSLEVAKQNLEKSEEEFKTSLNRLSIDMAKERERACKAEELLQETESCVNNCNTEIAILKERLTSGIEVEKKLEAELLLKSSTISELESKSNDLASKLEGKASELKNLNEKNLHLKNRVEDLEKVLEELTENLRVKSEELAQLLGQLEDLRVQNGRTGAENEKLVQENAVLMKEKDGLIEHAQELEKEYARSTEATNGNISDLMHDLEQKTREVQELKENSSVLEAKCANLANSLESYKNSLEEAKRSLEKSEAEFSTVLSRVSIDMEKERDRACKAEKLLQKSESCVKNCNTEIAILKERLTSGIEAEKKLKAEIKIKYGKKLEEMKAKMAHITGTEIEKVHAELARKNEELTAMQQNMVQLSRYDDEMIDLKRERGLLKSANIDANNRMFALNEALNKKCLEYDALRRKYEELSLQLDLWKRKYDMLDIPDCSSTKGLSYAGSSVSSFHSNMGLDERRSSCVSLTSIKSNGSTSSKKFVPQGAGSMFTCEDEDDGFQFSDKNLADLHRSSRCFETTRSIEDNPHERISEIQRRNTLLPVHMRSCYPSEEFGNDMSVDENQLRVMHNNGKKYGGNTGLQRQYGTLSLSKLKDDNWDDDTAHNSHQQRTPFSPTSARVNKSGVSRPSTSLGFSPMKPKMKSDSALTPGKKNKPSMFRVPFARD